MKIIEKVPKITGHLHYVATRRGDIVEGFDDHNLVVDAGRELMALIMTGKQTTSITKIGVGTGITPEAVKDTGLTDCVYIPLTARSTDGKTARFDFVIGTDQANGLNIHEFGLFAENGTMFSHRVRAKEKDLVKADDLELTGYWEINF